MLIRKNEIIEELKSVITGKTFDALLPPLVFVIANSLFGLDKAVITAIGLALIISFARLYRRQTWQYAAGGLSGVILAAGIAFLTRSATGYFIPAIISSSLLVLLVIVSLLLDKPLAAWASHLTRGWPLKWFWRSDVKPAYREVTLLWAALFSVRLIIQLALFAGGDAFRLGWASVMLGWPLIIAVLVVTYIYGTWRLRKLGGPGVDEYKEGKKPPWQGQTRGF